MQENSLSILGIEEGKNREKKSGEDFIRIRLVQSHFCSVILTLWSWIYLILNENDASELNMNTFLSSIFKTLYSSKGSFIHLTLLI